MSSIPQVYRINIGDNKNMAKALMAFLQCPQLDSPVIELFDKDFIGQGTLVPEEGITRITKSHLVMERELQETLERNDYAFNAFATFTGKRGIALVLCAAEMLKRFKTSSPQSAKSKEFTSILEDDIVLTVMCKDEEILMSCIYDLSKAMEYIEDGAKA